MTELIHDLKVLKHSHGVVGIKQSFEDEGVILDDVITMRRITELAGLELYIKIGGCEAKSDIQFCERIGVDVIIAPMIETEFAMQKYMEATQDSKMRLYFVCETKTSHNNIEKIILASNNRLSGIVIGRSDYCKSFKLSKMDVNSNPVQMEITNLLKRIDALLPFISTTMGGNISVESIPFIIALEEKKLLNKIETRNVVIDLSKTSVIRDSIQESLNFEIKWLKYKAQNYLENGNSYLERADLLEKRK